MEGRLVLPDSLGGERGLSCTAQRRDDAGLLRRRVRSRHGEGGLDLGSAAQRGHMHGVHERRGVPVKKAAGRGGGDTADDEQGSRAVRKQSSRLQQQRRRGGEEFQRVMPIGGSRQFGRHDHLFIVFHEAAGADT